MSLIDEEEKGLKVLKYEGVVDVMLDGINKLKECLIGRMKLSKVIKKEKIELE